MDESPTKDRRLRDFGVNISCYFGDYRLAKAACASIRYFMGDVPICLIIDGSWEPRELIRTYGVKFINKRNVKDQELKRESFGYGYTKMIEFWESPFERFLQIDADCVVWGDLSVYADFDNYDAIITAPESGYSQKQVDHLFFDTRKAEALLPGFRWQDCRCGAGSYFAGTGVIDMREYFDMLALSRRDRRFFFPGEQGMLNLLLWRSAQLGRLRVSTADYQVVPIEHTNDEMRKQFPFKNGVPVVSGGPKLIHWGGGKNLALDKQPYIEPLTFFRRRFLFDSGACETDEQADKLLAREDRVVDYYCRARFIPLKAKGFVRSLIVKCGVMKPDPRAAGPVAA